MGTLEERKKRLMRKEEGETSVARYEELEEASSDEGPDGDHCRHPRPDTCRHPRPDLCTPCQARCAGRYQVAVLSGVGFLLSFGIRCNLGVAVLAMTRSASRPQGQAGPRLNDTLGGQAGLRPNDTLGEPEFSWTPETVGLVDSSFFWGYILTQIPGGYLASILPATRWVLCTANRSVLCTANSWYCVLPIGGYCALPTGG
ncbi:hypothetical protein ACOMHN_002419 [Nucella lapillus]